MQAIQQLRQLGYTITTNGDKINATYTGDDHPDPATVRLLLEELRAHKQDAITYLQQRDTLPLTLDGADPAEEARARGQLRQRGFFLMFSQTLGEQVAVVEHDRFRQDVPQGIPIYALAEIRLLQQGVKAGTVRTIADLRLLHSAKKNLKGVIVR
jgi:hypothetical protein